MMTFRRQAMKRSCAAQFTPSYPQLPTGFQFFMKSVTLPECGGLSWFFRHWNVVIAMDASLIV